MIHLVRKLPRGVRDRGWVVHDHAAGGGGDDEGLDVTTDSSDRIVVTGCSETPASTLDVTLWVFETDGTVRETESLDGSAGGSDQMDVGWAIAAAPSGGIYLSGNSKTAAGDFDMVIWRHN